MQINNRRLAINKIALVVGLTLIRLPRLFGLNNNVWMLLLSMAPFWFVILENHLPDPYIKDGTGNRFIRLFLQFVSIIIVYGIILIISSLLVETFIQKTSIGLWLGSISIVVILVLAILISVIRLSAIAVLDKKLFWLGLAYFLILIVGMFRASYQASYDLLYIYYTFTIVIFCLSSMTIFHNQEQDYFYYVFLGLGLYLIVNNVLNLAGIENQTESYLREFQSVLLSQIGLNSTRVYYPLAEGINSFGILAGLCFVISAGYFIDYLKVKPEPSWIKIIPILTAGIAIFTIFRTDSRGALLFSFLATLWILILAFVKNKLVFLGSLLSHLSIFSIWIKDLNRIKFLAPFVRPNTNLLSGREIIWQAGIDYLKDFNWIHLVGYGLSGQYKSGLIQEYSYLFASYTNKTDIYLHHFGLQSIYDYGYIGLLIAYILMITVGLRLLENSEQAVTVQRNLPIIAGLVYIIFSGSVSIAPAIYAREIFFLFPFIWVSAVRSKK